MKKQNKTTSTKKPKKVIKANKGRKPSNVKDLKSDDVSGADDNRFSVNNKESVKIGNHKIPRMGNDYSWYNQVSSVLEPAAKISLNPIHGMSTGIIATSTGRGTIETEDDQSFASWKSSIPGFMILDYVGIFPTTIYDQSTQTKMEHNPLVKSVVKALFAQLKRNLNGPKVYNATDVAAYLITTLEITTYMRHLRRAYEMTFFTDPLSRYSRQNLVDAVYQPGTYNYLTNKAPEFITLYNMICLKLRNLILPINIPLKNKWDFLNSCMFRDEESPKSQLYIFKPKSLHLIDYENATPNKPYRLKQGLLGNEDVYQSLKIISNAVDQLLANDIISVINADILKAYPEAGNTAFVSPMDSYDNFEYQAVYCPEILEQIHHATVVNVNMHDYRVELDTRNYDFDIIAEIETHVNVEGTEYQRSAYITTTKDDLSVEDVTYKTRFMTLATPMYAYNEENQKYLQLINFYCGTEIITSARIVTLNSALLGGNVTNSLASYHHVFGPHLMPGLEAGKWSYLAYVGSKSVFKYAPIMYITYEDPLHEHENEMHVFGDIDNYGVVDGSTLENIHLAANASLVGLTDQAFISTELKGKS